MGFSRSASILSPPPLSLFLCSSPFFSIQLSSKALYWHDCPKLTIQLEGFTLQSLSCCVSLRLSLSKFPQPLCCLPFCLRVPFPSLMCLAITVSSLFPHLSPSLTPPPPSPWSTMAEVAFSAYRPRAKAALLFILKE